jgi:hypothetical protein
VTERVGLLNAAAAKQRMEIIRLIGTAVEVGNESYSAEDLGTRAVEALEAAGLEIVRAEWTR